MMNFVDEWSSRAADADGVVFDFGGVISVSPIEGWALYPFCAARGVDRSAVAAGWKNYRHLWDGGFISFNEMYRRIFADVGLSISDADFESLWKIDAEAWIDNLRPETLELMRVLRAQGKKLGLLSNMSPDFHERLFVPRAADYRALVDVEVISGLERLYKPERPIYDLTQLRMGIPAERLLFFDDTPKNVDAARAYGWQAEVYPIR